MSKRRLSEDEWIRASSQLPRSMAPQRDLWPGIADRIAAGAAKPAAPRKSRPLWMPALAAALVAALAVTLLVERPGQPTLQGEQPEPGGLPQAGGLMAAVAASEIEYRGEFRSFRPSELNLAWFDSEERQSISASWQAMHETEQALLTALESNPDSALLGSRLMDLRARQLGLMRTLHMLDQDSRRTT